MMMIIVFIDVNGPAPLIPAMSLGGKPFSECLQAWIHLYSRRLQGRHLRRVHDMEKGIGFFASPHDLII